MVFLQGEHFTDVMTPDGLHQLLNTVKWLHSNIEKYCSATAKSWLETTFKKINVKYYDTGKTKMRPLTGGKCKKFIAEINDVSDNVLSLNPVDSNFRVYYDNILNNCFLSIFSVYTIIWAVFD